MRGRRKVRTGVVVSDKMQKTVTVTLTEAEVDRLFHEVAAFPGFRLVVDLEKQTVATSDGSTVMRFDIDSFRKYCLVNGLDDIGLTLRHTDKIRAFEERRRTEEPWLFG